jgi:hypothetical protein
MQNLSMANPEVWECYSHGKGFINTIAKMTIPKNNDIPGQIHYLREVHKMLHTLANLLDVLPETIMVEYLQELIKNNVDNDIEGWCHLTKIIDCIRDKFRMLELMSQANIKSSTLTS